MKDREGIGKALDTVIFGGRVWTEEETWESVAVGIRGNRVAVLGSAEELEKQTSPETEWVDVKGGWVLSGFRETNLHLLAKPEAFRGERTASTPADAKPGIWQRIFGRKKFRATGLEGNFPFRSAVGESEAERWESAVLKVQEEALRQGVTRLECDEAVGPEGFRVLWRVLEGLEKRNALRIRFSLSVCIPSIDAFMDFLQNGLRTGTGSTRVRMGAVRVHAGPEERGSREELKRLSYLVHANGFQLVFRPISGSSLTEVFHALLHARTHPEGLMTKHRICFPPVFNESVLYASKELSAILEMSPDWLAGIWKPLREKRHPERCMDMYDWLTTERLLRICPPGEFGSPLQLIRNAAEETIGILSGENPGMASDRIEHAARLSAMQAVTAPVQSGQPADLAVLDADPLSVPLPALPEASVRLTVVDGEAVYRR
ncbi:hypothetical protein CLV97_13328 [Planifilum fimeticola]|uniref:Amidohydrolase family protein n=1 Tax=Planifilum fimeticola TaxID=201975 RepID=A0A2T0LAP3_9BACL|nr:hypothetical protein [Planifilum fimeticola]PRX38927.1 hypothetical protein CLV97_13328 [Planifilum fimeticola]